MLRIGATTTHYEVESSALVRASCPLLAEAATHIGDVQVRNRGTIGGSVAHADPAADYPAALLALEARVVLVTAKSQRELPIADFFVDTFTTALEPGELIREVIVPVEDQSAGTSYQKVVQTGIRFRHRRHRRSRPQVRRQDHLGARRRHRTGRQTLPGHRTSSRRSKARPARPADIQKAAALVADGVEANSDLHASAEYRKHLARVYTMRALAVASSRTA